MNAFTSYLKINTLIKTLSQDKSMKSYYCANKYTIPPSIKKTFLLHKYRNLWIEK